MTFIRKPFVSILLAASLSGGCGATPPRRVLFVGNSFTYYHDMPAVFAALVEANDGARPDVRLVASGGATLADHLEDSVLRRLLTEERWDAVVLQEQSTLGELHLVDGRQRVDGGAGFRRAAAALDSLARVGGSRVWLVGHWAAAEAPARDQAALSRVVKAVGRDLDAGVIPVGAAFAARREGGIGLYDADSLHPSPAGALLYACAVYRALLGRLPGTVPGPIVGPAIRLDDGFQYPDSVETLVDLPEVERAAVCAGSAVALPRVADDPVAPIDRPTLPDGGPVPPELVGGDWEGRLSLYPARARLRLHLSGAPSLELELDGGGRKSGRIDSVGVTGGVLEFVDPAGPNGTRVRYRARLVGDSLVGVASFGEVGNEFEGVGRWAVGRTRSTR